MPIIAVIGTPSHSYRVSLSNGITQCYLPPDASEHTPYKYLRTLLKIFDFWCVPRNLWARDTWTTCIMGNPALACGCVNAKSNCVFVCFVCSSVRSSRSLDINQHYLQVFDFSRGEHAVHVNISLLSAGGGLCTHFTVTTHLENLEKSGNSKEVRKSQEKWKSQGK